VWNVGFPCVVKPCSGGSSVGTSVVQTEAEYAEALELAFRYESDVLVETYIRGRELTVGVMDGKAMPVIEIIPKQGFYDYKNKYQAGATEEICPAQIGPAATERVQRLAERVFSALMLDAYCRCDFLWDTATDEFYCLEANTLPGMTPTSLIPQMAAAQGMSYGALCEKIIEVSMKKYRK
jgi:D-alanine-D-alanine ligase